MSVRLSTVTLAAALGLFAVNAEAQHEHHQDPAAAPAAAADKPDTAKSGGMSGAMMSGGMMAEMAKNREETAKLVDQLAQSFAALEAEKDPAKFQEALAAHGALVKQLQAKVQAESKMKKCP